MGPSWSNGNPLNLVFSKISPAAMAVKLAVFLCFVVVKWRACAAMDERTYIISTEKDAMPAAFTSHDKWYSSVLASVKGMKDGGGEGESQTLHVYDRVFHGFAAKLTEEEAREMEARPGVLGLIPDRRRQLHTTRTPEFLGLSSNHGLLPESHYGSDVIIGVLDTGIWPESESFKEGEVGPVPRRWKGTCEAGAGFNGTACNRKLVGARYFVRGYEAMSGPINDSVEARSPRDTDGHGTHTASTAAGRYVRKANMLGYAGGVARGVAPKARVATYKVCWASGCFDSDILAAFDQAVADGVDVISLSVGGGVLPYYMDSISIGAFGAMDAGVFVSASGGNQGPAQLTVTNVSPWIATVGASTLDRDFPADVLLGDGRTSVGGVSLYRGHRSFRGLYPLADSSTLVANGSDAYSAALCVDGSLDPRATKGKIVVCTRGNNPRVAKGEVVRRAGGAGMILVNSAVDGEGLVADAHVLPATAVGAAGGEAIRQYLATTLHPVATIAFRGTVVDVKPAPVVASFSSRGPNPQTAEILKPDLIAPGVNILAAWTGALGPSGLASDRRKVKFNIISGTSMACPHVSGVAALLRSRHPGWSPAALRSALMTTAYTVDNGGHAIADEATTNVSTPYDYGAGHVDPQRAMEPGLVYDMGAQDYVDFLCALNYTERAMRVITRRRVGCSAGASAGRPGDLNYPSFSAVFDQSGDGAHGRSGSGRMVGTFRRTVTNVGPANSTYDANLDMPTGVNLVVRPSRLAFSAVNQKRAFTLYVSVRPLALLPGDSDTVFGSLAWRDGVHVVRSPIAITRQQPY